MIGSKLSHFRIVEKLGEGGMGVVYRAEDENLGRQVALKVLHTEFVTDEERRQRFLREARTSALLTHPNIATVHEVGEEDGIIFIAMELVEGPRLSAMISRTPPPVEACLALSIQIAEGVARAHQSSVVHRDLKPENIHVDGDGRVKILDFGLAKLYHDPQAGDTSGLQTISSAVTRDGRILGTVAYMSPEQARGLDVDARSDVFSMGIVIYELLTGQRPFRGDTITDTLSAILRDPQPPIARFNPQVPVELERILARCLEKDPDDRYQHAGELLEDLRRLKRITDSQPVPLVSDPGVRPPRTRPAWLQPWSMAMGAGLLLLVALIGSFVARPPWRAADKPRALAVLPFENLQQRTDPDRLGQILQELVITDLSELGSLKVFSSQRLLDLQKQLGRGDRPTLDRDLATEVARRAGARIMLTGSLSQLGSTWILTTQLIDLQDGSVIESERIDGADLYAMVDNLTRLVRDDLGLADADDGDVAVSQRTSSSLEAYHFYLEGMDALNVLKWDDAAALFERAIDIDPSFGRAYYKLAIARWWGKSFNAYELGSEVRAPGDALRRLLAGGEVKLTRRDRLLAEAFLPLVEQRPGDAAPLFEELVRLYPDEKEAWYGLGEARFHRTALSAKREQSLEPFEKSIELDPSFSLAYYHVVDLYIAARRYDEGIAKVRAFMEQHPDDDAWHQDLARLVVAKGDEQEIHEVIEDSLRRIDSRADQRNFLYTVGASLAHQGDPTKTQALFERALAIDSDALQDPLQAGLADATAQLGDLAEAERLIIQVHQRDAKNTQALKVLFDLYDRTRRLGDAIAHAKRLIAGDPQFEHYYGHWVEAAVRKGDPAETRAALEAINGLIERSESPIDTLKLLGRRATEAFLSVGDYAGAEQCLEQALQRVPEVVDDAAFQTGLGLVAHRLSRPEQALEWFERALKNTPDDRDALYWTIDARSAAGDHEGAIRAARELSDLVGGGPWADSLLIEALLRAGRDDEATAQARAARESLRNDRERRVLHEKLGWVYLVAGRFDDAEREIRQAVALDPDFRHPVTHRLLVDVLLLRGSVDEAGAALGTALDALPHDHGLRRLQAKHWLLEGDARNAADAARALLASGPVHSDLHALLALSLSERKRFAEARDHAQVAMTWNPDRRNLTIYAWVLVRGDVDVAEGIDQARAALRLPVSPDAAARELPFVPSAEHALGLGYLKQQRFDEAIDQLEKAAKLRPDRPSILTDLQRATELSLATNRG